MLMELPSRTDDVASFQAFPEFAQHALAATFAPGYELKDRNMKKTVSNNLVEYSLGRKNLETYDLARCAGFCDGTPGCKAFNICEPHHLIST